MLPTFLKRDCRVTKEEGPNGALGLETILPRTLCLLQVKEGAVDEAVGEDEEVMVKKGRPALNGFHLNSGVSWRLQGQQGHLQGCHVP